MPGSIWAPGGQAVQATDEYVAVPSASIVLVCDDTVRSVMTAAWLRRMGYAGTCVLTGGTAGWTAAGRPLETGPAPTPVAAYADARRAVSLVSSDTLRREIERAGDLELLNVDQSDDYARGHVPGAGWLCQSRLELRIGSVAPRLDAPLVVTCFDEVASVLAAAALGRVGYTRVRALDGGTRAWEAAMLPVERGPSRLLDEPDDVVLKPYDRGRDGMEAYLRWEEALDERGRSPLFPPGASEPRPLAV